jgi:myo-inositol-1(or 4)-monophosphatase
MQDTYKQTAVKAAKEAGKVLMKYFRKGIKCRVKFTDNLVSKADLESEKKVISVIKKKYPGHYILSEEAGKIKSKSDYKWLIDPLDGTHNYLAGLNLFGVSIGLQYKHDVILGVVYLPVFDELYVAEKGKGAFMNGKRIHVSKTDKIKHAMVLYDGGLKRDKKSKVKAISRLIESVFRIRVLGAACVNLVYIAKGDSDIYIEHSTNPWDIGAGKIIVEEAGGKITNHDGSEYMDYYKGFVVSNGKLHKDTIKITKKF